MAIHYFILFHRLLEQHSLMRLMIFLCMKKYFLLEHFQFEIMSRHLVICSNVFQFLEVCCISLKNENLKLIFIICNNYLNFEFYSEKKTIFKNLFLNFDLLLNFAPAVFLLFNHIQLKN